MTGDQEGDELVVQVAVAQAVSLLVPGQNKQGEDIVSLGEARVRATGANLVVDEAVDLIAQAHKAPPGAKRPEVALQGLDHHDRATRCTRYPIPTSASSSTASDPESSGCSG